MPEQAAITTPTQPGVPGKTPYILVVEDDAFLVRAYEVMLTSQGYSVRIAADGEAALEHIQSAEPPGLILLDLMLPRKSGFEVLEAMGTNEAARAIPVIVLSNLGQPADMERATTLGAKAYFVKADTPLENVVSTVQQYVGAPPNK